jgi:hypothetical protein
MLSRFGIAFVESLKHWLDVDGSKVVIFFRFMLQVLE